MWKDFFFFLARARCLFIAANFGFEEKKVALLLVRFVGRLPVFGAIEVGFLCALHALHRCLTKPKTDV